MKSSLLYLAMAALLFVGCKEDEDDPDNPATAGTLKVEFHHLWNGASWDTSSTLTLADGRSVKFTKMSFIVSQVELIKNDGTSLPVEGFEGTVIDAGTSNESEFELENVPFGAYKGIRFTVGLDSATNHRDPVTLATTHPLYRPDMHWGWNPAAGYKFIVLEGQLDTSTSVGPQMAALQIHIAKTVNAAEVTSLESLPVSHTASGTTVHLNADYRTLFNGLPVNFFECHSEPAFQTQVDQIRSNMNSAIQPE